MSRAHAEHSDRHRARISVAVIVLNWNRPNETIVGLSSLLGQQSDDVAIVLLDNGSTDDSLDQIVSWLRHQDIMINPTGTGEPFVGSTLLYAEAPNFTVLKNATNEGFAGGNNAAIQFVLEHLDPEYIFLMNNDAVLGEECLRHSLELARTRRPAIVGALVMSADGQSVSFSGANPVKELFLLSSSPKTEQISEIWETGRVEGSGELVESDFLRAHKIRYGHYFDPDFFMYAEDIDLSFGARAMGRKILMSKNIVIYHGVALSSGGSGNPLQYYYITRNRILLAQRWLSGGTKLFFHLYYVPTRLMRIVQRWLAGKTDVASAIWEGVVDGYSGRVGKWHRH